MATLKPKFEQTGQTTVNRPINVKLAESISVEDFDGATDQIKVQAAFDSGLPIKFTRDYSVDSVGIDSTGQTIDFNGYSLIGTRPAGVAAQYVLSINGRELTLYNIKVNVNFKNYVCGIRWFSVSAGTPAQYNKVYGMHISNSLSGLIYGQEVGSPSVNAAQSENTIYSLTFRAVQKCFTGNQTNGFITLVSPILDCNPYEWASQPGYVEATWQAAALCILNPANVLVILGGEVLKTSTQLGYGVSGNSFSLLGTTIEIACANFYLDGGSVTIKDTFNFYMASDSAPVFTLSAAIVGDEQKPVYVDNCDIRRGNGVQTYSGETLVHGTSTSPLVFNFNNCRFANWSSAFIISNNAFLVGALKVTNAIGHFSNSYTSNYTIPGVFLGNSPMQNSSIVNLVTIASAATLNVYGVGNLIYVSGVAAIDTISGPYTSFRGSITIIPTGVFTTTAAGNIKIASTAVVGKALTMTYDGTYWYPSY